MNPDKRIIIDELLDRVNATPFVLIFEYKGVKVTEFSELRNKLSNSKAECHVAKNTYMRKALVEAGLPDIGAQLVGQTAFVTGESDVVGAAKAIADFIKVSKKGAMKGGILDGAVLSEEEVKGLADLPSREALLAKLLATINEPAASIARVIKAKFNPEEEADEAAATSAGEV